MRNLNSKQRLVSLIGVCIFFLSFNIDAQVQPLTVYFAGNDVNNLAPFIRTEVIFTPCGQGIRETTTDLFGKKASEKELCNGRRCGVTKIYKAGVLVKEINYLNDYVISYKSYVNGKLATEINADRSKIFVQGALVPLNWQRIYVKFNRDRIVMVSKKAFIDNLLKVQIPENVAAIMKDIDSQAGLNGVPGSNAVFNCDEGFSKVNDANIKLHGTTTAEKNTAQGFINNLGSSCSAITRDKINDSFNGKTGDAAKQERIAKANSRLDGMIAACQNRANSPGMFENPIIVGEVLLLGLETVLEGAAVTETAVLTAEGAAVASELVGAAVIDATIVDGVATVVTADMVSATASAGVVQAAEQTMIRSLPGISEAITELAANSGATASAAITRFTVAVTTAGAALFSAGTNAAAPTVEVCEVKDDSDNDANGQTMADAGQGQTPAPPKNPSAGSTTPDDAAGDNCGRLTRMRDYCNNNGWQTLECKDFAAILTGCGSIDPRIVYVDPQGEPTGSGCYNAAKDQAAVIECKKRSLIAHTINGGKICSSQGGFDLRNLVKDPGWYDPSPIDGKLYHNSFTKMLKGTKFTVLEGLSLKQLQSKLTQLTLSKTQTLVVFMDADCPASRSFAKTLASKEVIDAAQKGTDIIVVDAASDPAIASTYNIIGYPTTFIMSSTGKLSLPMLGALTVKEAVTTMLSK